MPSPAREKSIHALESLLAETRPYFDSPAEKQSRTYALGKWTMREILIHLSDTETVVLERLRRVVAEEKPAFHAFDQDRWAEHLNYKDRNLKLAGNQYEIARRGIVELALTAPMDIDARTGVHAVSGTRTFLQILQMVIDHNTHHLEQIKACAAGTTWTPKK